MNEQFVENHKLIFDTAISMIKKEGYSNFTMRALANEANIHHSTLYRHFKDMDELMYTLEAQYLIDINKSLKHQGEPTLTYESTYSFIKFVYDTKDYYFVLTQRESFRNMLLGRFNDGFDVNFYQSRCNSDANYLNYFMLIGSVAMLDFWIEDGCKETIEHMSKLIFDSCCAIVEMHHNNLEKK